MLITKGTRDEGYFWAARHKEKQMRRNLRELEKRSKPRVDLKQRTMEDFFAAASSSVDEKPIEEDKVLNESGLDELSIFSDEALSKLEAEIETGEISEKIAPSEDELSALQIFKTASNEEPSKDQEIKIFVDTRESKSGIAKELVELGIKIDLQQLEIAAYILSSRVGVERKDVADLSQSIIDGRLFPQLIALKRNYEKPILIIEGETLYGHRALNPEAIRGAISSIVINFDIGLIWSRNPKDTARFLRNIAKREQLQADKTPLIRTEKAPTDPSELLEFIVAGFPKINTVLARRILNKFGSLENFFNASSDELQELKGIGKKMAKEILEIIKMEYKPED